MKVKCESEVAQSCPTLSDSLDCSPPGSSIHGIFQAIVLEWGAIAFSEKSGRHHLNQVIKVNIINMGTNQRLLTGGTENTLPQW